MTTSPSPRIAAGVADGRLLFGGQSAAGDMGDSWIFTRLNDGSTAWTPVTATGPSARHGHNLETISIPNGPNGFAGQTVLFGGSNGTGYLGDTWTFGGSGAPLPTDTWQNRSTTGPSGREFAASAADRTNRNWVLFGGRNGSGSLGDTWLWNGSHWAQQSPTTVPPPRDSAFLGAIFNQQGITGLVLFGGRAGATVLGDTWVWNGSTWTQKFVTGPSPRYGAAKAGTWNNLMIGGNSGTGVLGDQWKFDGTAWVQVSGKGPAAREFAASDGAHLFGGRSGTTLRDDTNELTYPIPPCPSPCV
ncbi:MAG TPA: hypothetical protein VFJ85_02730 [Acidimicrobiales bacterium]|nr:hypothetical protein [Acidimicrobiales bacterium]